MPFRSAHELVGAPSAPPRAKGVSLRELSAADLAAIDPGLDPGVMGALDRRVPSPRARWSAVPRPKPSRARSPGWKPSCAPPAWIRAG